MAYMTSLNFAQQSGLGLRVVDENVGTGDAANKSFDLDNDNVVTSSYTLNVSTTGNSTNDFTALTETTDYVIDQESGRILLTTAGLTSVGTKVIYATYWYYDTVTEAQVDDWIAGSDSEVDLSTRKNWGTPVLKTEYQDGRASSKYPTTDQPYVTDWDSPDFSVLVEGPITKVDQAYFLNVPQPVALFYNYDADLATYTDYTTEVNSSVEGTLSLFASTPAANDIVYVGSSHPFLGLTSNLATAGVDSGVSIDWEYWNGSAWTDLSETDTDSGASQFTASGLFTWTYPAGWAKNSVNSSSDYYWVRGKLNETYDTPPVLNTLTIRDSVNVVIEQRQLSWETWGEINFMGLDIQNGTKNLRVDYWYGMSSTPEYITELSSLYSSIRAYVSISGGSYDDATSYTLGSKQISIGEVYVNIAQVIKEFKARIKELNNMIGTRANVRAI